MCVCKLLETRFVHENVGKKLVLHQTDYLLEYQLEQAGTAQCVDREQSTSTIHGSLAINNAVKLTDCNRYSWQKLQHTILLY
jgi:hypothetical protein